MCDRSPESDDVDPAKRFPSEAARKRMVSSFELGVKGETRSEAKSLRGGIFWMKGVKLNTEERGS